MLNHLYSEFIHADPRLDNSFAEFITVVPVETRLTCAFNSMLRGVSRDYLGMPEGFKIDLRAVAEDKKTASRISTKSMLEMPIAVANDLGNRVNAISILKSNTPPSEHNLAGERFYIRLDTEKVDGTQEFVYIVCTENTLDFITYISSSATSRLLYSIVEKKAEELLATFLGGIHGLNADAYNVVTTQEENEKWILSLGRTNRINHIPYDQQYH